MTVKKALQETATSVVAVVASFAAATWTAFTADSIICGEANGANAAGGGAAIGMLVLFYIGIPTILLCSITEASRLFIAVRLRMRIFWLVLPVVLSAVFMAYFSSRI
jgi:hypothetical protein